MKKIYTTLVAVLAIAQFSYAQWSTVSGPIPTTTTTDIVGIGTTNPQASLDLTVNRTKTAVGGVYSYFGKTNEASNYAALQLLQSGATNAINRYWSFQTIEQGIANAGSIVFQPNGGNVGIGTTNPSQPLTVNGRILASFLALTGNLGISNNADSRIYLSNTTPSTGQNWNIVSETDGSYRLGIYGLNPFQTITSTGNIGIGTASPDAKLTVNGTIHASEVKVDTSIPVPDYVFEPAYKLLQLSELKTYLDVNHHLPDIPSAAELTKNGLNLSEMNLKLLKKIEELTLYLIEKDAQLKDLKTSQQKQIDELKTQLNLLQKTPNH